MLLYQFYHIIWFGKRRASHFQEKKNTVYKTLIVIDNKEYHLDENFADMIDFDTYLTDYPKQNEPKTRIINLCDTRHYLSKGYYCSLLAEARCHKILPSVKTINGLKHLNDDDEAMVPYKSYLMGLNLPEQALQVMVYFGHCDNQHFQPLATRLFNDYQAPLLKLVLTPANGNWQLQVEHISISALNDEQRTQLVDYLTEFTHKVWRVQGRRKRYRWEMAILVNPEEKVPPSNKEAITKFVKAAAKNGIHAEALSIEEMQNIAYYDALFIRETTAIDHHTYRLACKAENNSLVVIDDPVSILRCCNKVFLHDAFSYQKVPSLKTIVVNGCNDDILDQLEEKFGYPLVLKMPEGSFSRGVYKVSNRQELKDKLCDLFNDSALVLAQEFLYTDFDWRIGILNNRAIYACRYKMARNHWQIYNHGSKRYFSGGFETLPTFEAPKSVLDAALKAAKIVGDSLYGVDVKECDNIAYVLEVNDNPSIEHKVEDAYLRDELYMQIMSEFQRRLETRGR